MDILRAEHHNRQVSFSSTCHLHVMFLNLNIVDGRMSVKKTRKGCLCDNSTVRGDYPAAANLKVKVEIMLTRI